MGQEQGHLAEPKQLMTLSDSWLGLGVAVHLIDDAKAATSAVTSHITPGTLNLLRMMLTLPGRSHERTLYQYVLLL